jgi:hypothetical protein
MKTKKTIHLLTGILFVPTSFLLIFSFLVGACKKEIIKSDEKDILSFSLFEEKDTATIDKINKTITNTVKYNTDLTKLSPHIIVSQSAFIVPASGVVVDFSKGPITYTVTAEDKTTQQWTVTVTKDQVDFTKDIVGQYKGYCYEEHGWSLYNPTLTKVNDSTLLINYWPSGADSIVLNVYDNVLNIRSQDFNLESYSHGGLVHEFNYILRLTANGSYVDNNINMTYEEKIKIEGEPEFMHNNSGSISIIKK